ncbi:MAG: glucosaminidase domain-containing protein [Desulfurococcales archaeon]|nr:glucosaminidase domain-containing protein [Desulfurococcales archaeon]
MSAQSKKHYFLKTLLPWATKVELATGFPALLILTHAALETGWNPTGFANNLFGIKDLPWDAGLAYASTKEYIDGQEQRIRDAFEDFTSPLDSMICYVILIKHSKRYQKAWEYAINHEYEQYFEELQRAGYATDPKFAYKLKRVLKSVRKGLEELQKEG